MDNSVQNRRKLSVDSSDCNDIEVITTTHVTSTPQVVIGSNVHVANSRLEPQPHVNLDEQININITGPTTLQSFTNATPIINILNYGPTIQFSDQMMDTFRKEGCLNKMVTMLYKLSLEQVKEQNQPPIQTVSINKDSRITIVCQDKGLDHKKSVWSRVVPLKYLNVARGTFTVLMLGALIGVIYGAIYMVQAAQKYF